jgi:hypothetical protein
VLFEIADHCGRNEVIIGLDVPKLNAFFIICSSHRPQHLEEMGGGKEWKYVANQKGVVEVGDEGGEEEKESRDDWKKKKWRTAARGRKENVCAAKHRTSGR